MQRHSGLIVFSNSSDNPDTSDRTIGVTVTDVQGGVSNAATTTVHVTAVDDAPVMGARLRVRRTGSLEGSRPPWCPSLDGEPIPRQKNRRP